MKYQIARAIIVSFLLTFSAVALSATLASFLDSMHSMQADFVQTILDNRGQVIQKAHGKMALARPGKFRWETTKPIPQLIVANGSKIWIYDPDLQQVVIRHLKRAAGEAPALLLSNVSTDLAQSFNIKPENKKMAAWNWFMLTPKGADNMFKSVELGFNRQQIQQMILEDNLGHRTRIEFQHIKTNQPLAESLFNFKVPPKVDVIDESKRQ